MNPVFILGIDLPIQLLGKQALEGIFNSLLIFILYDDILFLTGISIP